MIKNIVVIVAVALLAFIAGVAIPKIEIGETVKTQELPLAPELLLNPIYYEWWASAEGTLVKKTENSITLEKEGKQATVIVKEHFTEFYLQDAESGQITPTTFDEVVIGSKLRGGVLMSKKDTLGLADEENVAVGNSFVVILEPSP